MSDNNPNIAVEEFNPLDMNNYRVEKLPKIEKSGFEKILMYIGGPLAILLFILLYWFVKIPFLENTDSSILTKESGNRYAELGLEGFTRINYAMLAIFVAWIMIMIWGETVLKWLGYTNGFFF